MSLAKRTFAILFAAAAVGAVVPLGCRQALGIQEVGSDLLTCDLYCDTIATACTGPNLQYASRDACIGLCNNLPVGTSADQEGNTLGCRLNRATKIAQTLEGDCSGAGPGGNDLCGHNCDAFCEVALKVCPQDYKDNAACQLDCLGLPDKQCASYSVDPTAALPDQFSLQCRLFHLTAATIDPTTHCPHVAGKGVCNFTSPACTPAPGVGDGG